MKPDRFTSAGINQNGCEWISTGKAAALLGYSRDHFREKFEGLIPHRRIGNGHLRWLASEVQRLGGPDPIMPEAG